MTEFQFDEGDTVLVRVYKQGKLRVKFVAECIEIRESPTPLMSDYARFDMPFGTMNSVTIKPYEGEFEVVEGEVNF